MIKWVRDLATALLVVGYIIHSVHYFVVDMRQLGVAMILFALAMICLFI